MGGSVNLQVGVMILFSAVVSAFLGVIVMSMSAVLYFSKRFACVLLCIGLLSEFLQAGILLMFD